MIIKNCRYTSDCSDLLVTILQIYFKSPKFIKCKVTFTNKFNGLFYSTEVVKLEKDKIKHWKRVDIIES